MSDVFISYARQDQAKVHEIALALQNLGWSVFWDPVIPAGKSWRDVIETNLRKAKCIVVVWSGAAIVSRFVIEEADQGIQRNILVPILIENVLPPFGFQSIQAADLSTWDGATTAAAFQKVVGGIATLAGDPQTFKQPQATFEKATPVDISVPAFPRRSQTLTQPRPEIAKSGDFTDVIVAVRGIRPQMRYSAIHLVANGLAGARAFRSSGKSLPVGPQPLGYFHGDERGSASVIGIDRSAYLGPELSGIGFAEVHWAKIPDDGVREHLALEETKSRSRGVLARAQAFWARASTTRPEPDFGQMAEVLDEIIETIYLLENVGLGFLPDKTRLLRLGLRETLEEFLVDVQLVAGRYRNEIVMQFHHQMKCIYDEVSNNRNGQPRLHVVAHGEGTVVSFLGLLQAMSGMQLTQTDAQGATRWKLGPTDAVPDWLRHVEGYMTLGCPIDMHILLWPEMWSGLDPSFANAHLKPGQINWRNYYDFGDPVGYSLNTARQQLAKWGCTGFKFRPEDDFGFARYLRPGNAHNDYWDDHHIFEDFVHEVGMGERPHHEAAGAVTPSPAPPSNLLVHVLSPMLPYLLSATLLLAGVYVFATAILDFAYPLQTPSLRRLLVSQIGIEPTPTPDGLGVFRLILGVTALIIGTTLLSRFPRLGAGKRWLGAGLLAFALGCATYTIATPLSLQHGIGMIFPQWGSVGHSVGTYLLAFAIGMFGLLGERRNISPDHDRRKRWLLRGVRPLMLGGAFAVAALVVFPMFPQPLHLDAKQREMLSSAEERSAVSPNTLADIVRRSKLDQDELKQLFSDPAKLPNLPNVASELVTRPPLWPLVVTGALFFYLWWLATLIFDLAFVWHRYTRQSVAMDTLASWKPRA